MIKLINLICLIISSIVLAAMFYAFGDIVNEFAGLGMIELDEVLELLTSGGIREAMMTIAILGASVFAVFGFPLTVFLVSLNGLKKR